MNPYRVRFKFPPAEEVHRLSVPDLRSLVETLLGATLEELGRDGREPDQWEQLHLSAAVGFLHAGLLRAALAVTWQSLLLQSERAGVSTLQLPAGTTDFPMAKLRQVFEYARHAELGPFANDALDRRAWLGRISKLLSR